MTENDPKSETGGELEQLLNRDELPYGIITP